MRQVEPQPDDPIRPLDWYKILPFEAAAASDRLEWVGMAAARIVRRLPLNSAHPPLPTTCSSSMPGRRRSWTCAMKG